MSVTAEIIKYSGKHDPEETRDIIVLKAGKYTAHIAPFMGSNIFYMKDNELDIDFFRHDANMSVTELKENSVVYGFPTLLYGNRLSGGTLRASDHTYQFEPNDPEGNYLHGFLHTREHEIVEVSADELCAIGKTRYVYDEKDPLFETFPVAFTAEYTFSLSSDGMHYSVKIINNSKDRLLPYGICNHTCFNAPFTTTGKPLDTRLFVTIGNEKWILNRNFLPTTETIPLDNHDKQYQTGSMIPVKHIIDNDIYPMVRAELPDSLFRGAILSDSATGKEIHYEVDDNFKFWIIWNDRGEKGYFCPEPITWMIDAPNLHIHNEESGYLELAPGAEKTLYEHIYSKLN